MPTIAPVLLTFHKLFTWLRIVPFLKFIARFFARLAGSSSPAKTLTTSQQSYVKVLLQETKEEGFLSTVQTDIISRLTSASHLSIKSVMTPINRTRIVRSTCNRSRLIDILKASPFTRLPVYTSSAANIVGFINIYEPLNSSRNFTDLTGFIKPIPTLNADTIVIDAIGKMQTENMKIVLVTHGRRDRPVGIVTMKDLFEELVGELTEW